MSHRRLLEIAARFLDATDRETVLGDLAESGETRSKALREVLGLVVRRQAGLWRDWHPWVALLALTLPVGLLLSLSSASLVGRYDLYLWIFRNYGTLDPAVLSDTGLTARNGLVALGRWLPVTRFVGVDVRVFVGVPCAPDRAD
jgi:hypothetical protein